MPIIHKNCLGDTYYLHEGKTKTGKPKYYVSKKSEGNLAEAIPDGYEIYERPGGLVSFRKIQNSPILPHELKYVQDKITPLVDQEEEKEIARLSSKRGTNFASLMAAVKLIEQKRYRTRFEAEIRGKEIIIYETKHGGRPIMKFELIDEDTREYLAYRWCFKGSIDDWIHIGYSGQLRDLVDKYCPALGTDRFYELFF